MNPDVFITIVFAGTVTLGAVITGALLLWRAHQARQKATLGSDRDSGTPRDLRRTHGRTGHAAPH